MLYISIDKAQHLCFCLSISLFINKTKGRIIYKKKQSIYPCVKLYAKENIIYARNLVLSNKGILQYSLKPPSYQITESHAGKTRSYKPKKGVLNETMLPMR